jgi:CheY-like chemotaxis protein
MSTISPTPVDLLLKGARVLLVEDEWMISALLADLLHEFGCEVVGPASHITQAVELASVAQFDCALLDLNLAGEPVYPVATILSGRNVPFAFITGYRQNQIELSFRERPILRKPFSSEDLSQILVGLLNKSTT